jgi:hypothetical protein
MVVDKPFWLGLSLVRLSIVRHRCCDVPCPQVRVQQSHWLYFVMSVISFVFVRGWSGSLPGSRGGACGPHDDKELPNALLQVIWEHF